MILYPDLWRPLARAWAVLVLALVAGLLGLWWVWDEGQPLEEEYDRMLAEKKLRTGPLPLRQRLEEQRTQNRQLAEDLAHLKKEIGFIRRPPYLVPADHTQPGVYFLKQLDLVQDPLRQRAKELGIGYQEKLGFRPYAGEVPRNADAPYLLDMLQLTRKLAIIPLNTPGSSFPVKDFSIQQPNFNRPPREYGEPKGWMGRPPLMREYPLRLRVTAYLDDIIFILHRFSQFTVGGDDFPLALRGLSITGKNISEKEMNYYLDAEFEVVGMQFLAAEERNPGSRATGGGLGGGPVPVNLGARP